MKFTRKQNSVKYKVTLSECVIVAEPFLEVGTPDDTFFVKSFSNHENATCYFLRLKEAKANFESWIKSDFEELIHSF